MGSTILVAACMGRQMERERLTRLQDCDVMSKFEKAVSRAHADGEGGAQVHEPARQHAGGNARQGRGGSSAPASPRSLSPPTSSRAALTSPRLRARF